MPKKFKGPALYLDEGRRITTHSMLKQMARCPKATQYKYAERLKSKLLTARDKPLHRGSWFHSLLEEYYAGRSWKARHTELTAQFNELFDEEKEALGDLPTELATLMRSYLWHYGADKSDPYHGWDVLGTEVTLECPWPDSEDGMDVYRCRVDVLLEDQWGLWIADHKTNKSLPSTSFRMLDAASPLYIWCARENGYDVRGFMWNYISTKAPTVPKLVYVGKSNERLSTRSIETDYPTFRRALKEYGLDPVNHKAELDRLKAQRWEYGAPQSSAFFRRDSLEKPDDMIARVVAVSMKTRDRLHEYDWDDRNMVERSPDYTCERTCSFSALCETEHFDGNAQMLRKKLYRIGDPLDYYQDRREG
jgi:hypothetical protein